MKPITILVRATIFVPQFIGYSADNKEKLKDLLPGAQILAAGFVPPMANPNFPLFAIPDGIPWQMVRDDFSIQFFPNKIDIVQNKILLKEDEEDFFKNNAIDVFEKIMKIYDIKTAKRLAYAPIYAIDNSEDFSVEEYLNKLVNISSFMEKSPQEIVLNINYKIEYKGFHMNFLSKISEGTKSMTKDSNVISKCVVIDLDLNTIAEEVKDFNIDNIKLFFDTIGNTKKDYIQHLLKM